MGNKSSYKRKKTRDLARQRGLRIKEAHRRWREAKKLTGTRTSQDMEKPEVDIFEHEHNYCFKAREIRTDPGTLSSETSGAGCSKSGRLPVVELIYRNIKQEPCPENGKNDGGKLPDPLEVAEVKMEVNKPDCGGQGGGRTKGIPYSKPEYPMIFHFNKGIGQLCEHCGEILEVTKKQHYRQSVKCVPDFLKCDKCDKRYHCRSKLKEHVMSHAEELPYACNMCPMKYRYRANLRRHLRLHVEGNAYVCDECGKSFSTRHYMRVHKRVHIDPSLAKLCDYCTEKFENEEQLDNHIEDRHIDRYIEDRGEKNQPLRIIQCKFCHRQFFNSKRHATHLKGHEHSKRRQRAKNANKTYVELEMTKRAKCKQKTDGDTRAKSKQLRAESETTEKADDE